MSKNIFIIGADSFNMQKVRKVEIDATFKLHELLSFEEVRGKGFYPVEECLAKAKDRLHGFDGSIDAIIGYWDFPVTTLVPILCREYGLPSPSLESVLRCEHKYWSRLEQRKVIPDMTPRFDVVDPFDDAAYNVEYFYQPKTEQLTLLEINPRLSQSHADMFEKVDGASNFQIMLELALGREPDFPLRRGRYGCAAKFHVRVFEDGIVSHAPDASDIQRIEQEFPETRIELKVRHGTRLSEMLEQDSYSYDIAHVHTGARDRKALLKKYNRILEALHFEFEPVPEKSAEAPEVMEISA